MNHLAILKALANVKRLQILKWLKDPATHFPHANPETRHFGVCCGYIQEKAGLSQSTTSSYLSMMEKCGLLTATREKQWTYYKRNEDNIQALARFIQEDL